MNKWTYIVGFYGCLGAIVVVLAFSFMLIQQRSNDLALGVAALAIPFVILAVVIRSICVFKMWAAIQDGRGGISPGVAVVLSLPIIGIIGNFWAFGGFPTAYNRYVERHGLDLRPLSRGVYLTFAICVPLGIIPYVGAIPSLVGLVMMGLVFSQSADAANALQSGKQQDVAAGDPGSGVVPAQASARPREGLALGLFALLWISFVIPRELIFLLAREGPPDWMEFDPFILLKVTWTAFAAIPLAMGCFVRRPVLQWVVILLGIGYLWLRTYEIWKDWRLLA